MEKVEKLYKIIEATRIAAEAEGLTVVIGVCARDLKTGEGHTILECADEINYDVFTDMRLAIIERLAYNPPQEDDE